MLIKTVHFFLQKEASKSGNLKVTFMAEEKIKKLKKRNSELVSIARQLEDKAKKLQEEKVTAQVRSRFVCSSCYISSCVWLNVHSYQWRLHVVRKLNS